MTAAGTARGGIAALAGALALAALLRLPALLAVPIFFDESVYLERALAFPARLPLTIADGKLVQELALAALVHLPGDPLAAGRALSLLCGLATVALLWALGRELGRPGAGLLAGLLYAASPLATLHDALALPDSMLTAVAVLVAVASLRFARAAAPTRAGAARLGALVGLAALVKLPGLFLALVPALAVAWLCATAEGRLARRRLLPTALIVALLPLAALALLHYGGAEGGKLGGDVLATRAGNAARVGDWLLRYLPAPLLLLPAASLYAGRRAGGAAWRATGWLLSAGLGFTLIFLAVGDRVAPRYLQPAWPLLLMACALAAGDLWRVRWGRAAAAPLLACALALGAVPLAFALGRPDLAPLAENDRRQYLETWTAGYHAAELVGRVRAEAAARGAVTVVNHDQPRLVHNLPLIYLRDDPRVRVETLDLTAASAPAALDALAARGATLVLLDEQEREAFDFEGRFPRARLLAAYQNPTSPMRFLIYMYDGEVAP